MLLQTIANLLKPKPRLTHVQIQERIDTLRIYAWIESLVVVREGSHYRVLELSALSKQWGWTDYHFNQSECFHLLEAQSASISDGLDFIYGSAYAAPTFEQDTTPEPECVLMGDGQWYSTR